MSRHRKENTALQKPSPLPGTIFLAVLLALYVARLFVPEDPGSRQGYGAPYTMLWLLLATAWFVTQLRRGGVTVVASWTDAFILLLVAWCVVSGIVAFVSGSPRPALNATWDWISVGLGYFMARQLIRGPMEARSIIAIMIGVAVGLALLGFYQVAIQLPEDQACYERNKDDTLALYQATGQWLPLGSNLRQQFENRLYSGQPTATFALTNSLAGFLVPWLVALAGVVLLGRGRQPAAVKRSPRNDLSPDFDRFVLCCSFAVQLILVLILVSGLCWTHSRSGIIATLLGCATLCCLYGPSYQQFSRRLRWGLLIVLSFLVVGVAVLINNRLPLSHLGQAAYRSLHYRFEYWWSTCQMIAENLLFGCGPGQFQDIYTRYKLPGASETVQDPHNWLLEVWATSGTLAMLALAASLVATAWTGRWQVAPDSHESDLSETTSYGLSVAAKGSSDLAIGGGLAGLLLGMAIAWLTGFSTSRPAMLLLLASIVVTWLGLRHWVRDGVLRHGVPMVAAGALLVNLFAAGGITYPCIADSLWLLLAMTLNLVDYVKAPVAGRQPSIHPLSQTSGILISLLLGGLLLGAMVTEYQPVLGARLRLGLASSSLADGQTDLVRQNLEAAVAADRWSGVAAQRLAFRRLEDYRQQPQASVLTLFEQANSRMLRLAPKRSRFWQQSAEAHRVIFDESSRREDLLHAIQDVQHALKLYPTLAELHLLLAELYWLDDQDGLARGSAIRALELDDQMQAAGHADRQLDKIMRRELEQKLAPN
jgi:hypothetical protein